MASPLPSGNAITVSSAGIAAQLAALDQIAKEHEGVRTAGTPGYTASVDHVVAQLRSFGYTVTTPVAEMSLYRELPGSTVEVDGGPSFAAGDEFRAMIYSGSGDLTAPIDEVTGGEGGCEPADFDGFQRGAIALAPGGACFRQAGCDERAGGRRGSPHLAQPRLGGGPGASPDVALPGRHRDPGPRRHRRHGGCTRGCRVGRRGRAPPGGDRDRADLRPQCRGGDAWRPDSRGHAGRTPGLGA